MPYDESKIDDAVLALLHLTIFDEQFGMRRAWKSHDWAALDRLHARGFIADPKAKARSVILTSEGARRAEELCRALFGR